MARNVVPNTGVETIGTPDKRWSAIYADKLYLADRDSLSSVSDGIADATPVLQSMLDIGGKVQVPAGTYRLTDTLTIPVYKTELQGERGTVFVADSSMNNKPILQFVNDEAHGSYLYRRYTTSVHGGFSVIGSQSTNCIAMQIGEGSYPIDCVTFHDIVLEGAETSLKLEAHTYKNTFLNIIFNSHANTKHGLVTTVTDSGEATVFVGCAFWAGDMLIAAPASFLGCTIHLFSGKIKTSATAANLFFAGCHFELLNYNTPNTEAFILASNGLISIDDSEFILTTIGYTMGYPLFEAVTSSTSRSGAILINNCSMEGWWGGLANNDTNQSITISKGYVVIRNSPYAYFNDNACLFGRAKSLYDYSDLTLSRFSDTNKWVADTDDTAQGFSVSDNKISVSSGNLRRYIKFALPSDARSVIIHCHYSATKECTFNMNSANSRWQGIGFFDENGNFVKPLDVGNSYYQSVSSGLIDRTFLIPPNARYVGVGFYSTGENEIDVSLFGVEYM